MAGKAEISQIYDAETVIWRVGAVILVAVKRYEGERSVSRDRNLIRFRYILRADRNGRNDFAAGRIENARLTFSFTVAIIRSRFVAIVHS
jgi:hypothetical protein